MAIDTAMMLRQRNAVLPVTEAHPKAFLWMLREATRTRKATSVAATFLAKYFNVGAHAMTTDHERDAALGALAAWAMAHQAAGWKDIRGLDPDAIGPLAAPLGYWIPDGALDGDSRITANGTAP